MEYRLKINGVKFPDTLIQKGSYSLHPEKRVKGSWKDGLGIEHYAYHPKDRITIEFTFREIRGSERDTYYDALQQSENVEIQYYDDRSKTYKTGIFRRESILHAHSLYTSSEIVYAPQKIKYVEY